MIKIKNIWLAVRNNGYQSFMMIAVSVTIFLQVSNSFERTAAVADIKSAAIPNRRMLNSRAQIQIILINATLEGRTLNATEIDRIKVLWHSAEYDQTNENADPQK